MKKKQIQSQLAQQRHTFINIIDFIDETFEIEGTYMKFEDYFYQILLYENNNPGIEHKTLHTQNNYHQPEIIKEDPITFEEIDLSITSTIKEGALLLNNEVVGEYTLQKIYNPLHEILSIDEFIALDKEKAENTIDTILQELTTEEAKRFKEISKITADTQFLDLQISNKLWDHIITNTISLQETLEYQARFIYNKDIDNYEFTSNIRNKEVHLNNTTMPLGKYLTQPKLVKKTHMGLPEELNYFLPEKTTSETLETINDYVIELEDKDNNIPIGLVYQRIIKKFPRTKFHPKTSLEENMHLNQALLSLGHINPSTIHINVIIKGILYTPEFKKHLLL